MTTTYLPTVQVTQIRAHGANPRRQVGDITELADSIKAHGLLEPLVVAPINGVEFLLIAGHRRLAAAKAAGQTAVPCMLREDLDTPPKQLEAMLVENTQRVDLSPVEEAAAYQSLLAFPGYTVTKVAKATGRAAKTIKSRVALATLPEKTQTKVHDGTMTLGDAEALLEFVGTPEWDDLVKAAGTANFAFTVTRAREKRTQRDALAAVEKACADRGWEITSERPRNATNVMSSYTLPKNVAATLTALEGVHVLVRQFGTSWSLVHPYLDDETEDDDLAEDLDPEWKARRDEVARVAAARDALNADLETARQTRIAWALGRCGQLRLTDVERLAVLRLLVEEMLDTYDVDGASLDLCGAPSDDSVDDGDLAAAQSAWAANLTENEAWRALVVLGWDLGRCGSPRWPHDHKQSIRVAAALGYTVSDVEAQLLGGESA